MAEALGNRGISRSLAGLFEYLYQPPNGKYFENRRVGDGSS